MGEITGSGEIFAFFMKVFFVLLQNSVKITPNGAKTIFIFMLFDNM